MAAAWRRQTARERTAFSISRRRRSGSDLDVGPNKLRTYFNKPWLDFTGRSIEEELGDGWAEDVHSEDRQRYMDTYSGAFDRREEFRIEYRLRRHDGKYRWLLAMGVPRFNEDRSFAGYVGVSVDVTDGKVAGEALKKSEEKFAKAFRESPVAFTLTSATDYHYLDVNGTFERLTGWRRDEVIGRSPFDFNIWINPARRNELVERARSEGGIQNAEIRYRSKDGTERVGLVSAELIEIGGELCILAAIADITEQKRAAEALADVGRKLVEAQEQERARIARELHDDIAQRLALLAIELGQLLKQVPDSVSELRPQIGALQNHTIKISSDVQKISHELHSSRLQYLGIVVALKGLCREFGERQKVEVDFKSHDVPSPLPSELSLCLFRVVQEALQNAVKHSGVRHFDVELWSNAEEIHLSVSDSGKGFDTEAAIRGTGLGLTSMQERVRLLNGQFEIQSSPAAGTTIRARVPLDLGHKAQRAVG